MARNHVNDRARIPSLPTLIHSIARFHRCMLQSHFGLFSPNHLSCRFIFRISGARDISSSQWIQNDIGQPGTNKSCPDTADKLIKDGGFGKVDGHKLFRIGQTNINRGVRCISVFWEMGVLIVTLVIHLFTARTFVAS
jgi:hypothetical protein